MLSYLDVGALIARLLAGAGMSLVLFAVLPFLLARLQGVEPASGFQLRRAPIGVFIAAVVLGFTLWPLAYDLIVLCQKLGIATLTEDKIKEHQAQIEEFVRRLQAIHPLPMILAGAVVPAIGEELFFRGYLLGALRGRLPAWAAICLIAFIFGLPHASLMGLIAVERVASSTLLGVALGWICWRSQSVFPGMLLHAINNGLMLSLFYSADRWRAWGYNPDSLSYLPPPLVAISTAAACIAFLAIAWLTRQPAQALAPTSALETALPGPDATEPANKAAS
jgi:ABC-2 type transport system permease protein/sodium transport system permease protein